MREAINELGVHKRVRREWMNNMMYLYHGSEVKQVDAASQEEDNEATKVGAPFSSPT